MRTLIARKGLVAVFVCVLLIDVVPCTSKPATSEGGGQKKTAGANASKSATSGKDGKGGKDDKGGADAGSDKGPVCVNQRGFTFQQKFPAKSHMAFCHAYKASTCCNHEMTTQLRRRHNYMIDDISEECARIWKTLDCTICNPDVGTLATKRVCQSFCNRAFEACRNDFFVLDPMTQLMVPCQEHDLVCSPTWVTSGTEFCKLAGFEVGSDQRNTDSNKYCFGGREPRISKTEFVEPEVIHHPSTHKPRESLVDSVVSFFSSEMGGAMVQGACMIVVVLGLFVLYKLTMAHFETRKKHRQLQRISTSMDDARKKQQALYTAAGLSNRAQ